MFKVMIKGPEAGKIQRWADTIQGQLKQAVDVAVKTAESNSKRFYLGGPNYRGAKNPTPGPDGILGWKTGHLKGSVRSRVEDGKPIRGILSAGPLPYAAIHEFGGMAGRERKVKIPQRSYLSPALFSKQWVIDPLKAMIKEIFTRFGR